MSNKYDLLSNEFDTSKETRTSKDHENVDINDDSEDDVEQVNNELQIFWHLNNWGVKADMVLRACMNNGRKEWMMITTHMMMMIMIFLKINRLFVTLEISRSVVERRDKLYLILC